MKRDKLGVLVVEEAGGGVAVQLFEDSDRAAETFEELNGRIGEKPWRATFVKLAWTANGVVVRADSRKLPVPKEETPDGWKLGSGPIRFPKEEKEKKA